MDRERTLQELKEEIRVFCEKRDWGQFHDAKELAVALATETGELLEHFRYRDADEVSSIMEDDDAREEVENELADVFYHVLRIAQLYDIDISEAFDAKLEEIGEKYPVEKAKGSNKKYDELE
ncbi:MAG: nucleotide pyrophosphohydrolase [Candidatus Nanohaloarchaea archaeon]|nr:nucleotide pyrophosphohydrolase [Candidatus Nanohaloarchaea archaeon]